MISIVIPTYNEIENIKKLIPALADEFKKHADYDFHVLIVDGDSPDGTSEVVKEFEKQTSFVRLLMEEKKAGLGAAYTFGFKHAIDNFNPDIIVEMDADFQHPPRYIKNIFEYSNKYDVVIFSRFLKKSKRYFDDGKINKESNENQSIFFNQKVSL